MAHIIDPDFRCIILVCSPTVKEQDVGLHALGVENAGRKAQNGVEIAFIHQVTANLFACAIRKEDIIRHYDSGTSCPFSIEGIVNDFQKIELLIRCGISKVVTGSPFTALFRTKGRIGQNDVEVLHPFPCRRKAVALFQASVHIMQIFIHKSQTMSSRD